MLSLLLASYAGYVQVFTRVAAYYDKQKVTTREFRRNTSKTKEKAILLAKETFGPRHWTTDSELLHYYNVEHGYYIYAKNYVRRSGGKEVDVSPFALIWQSRDGTKTQTTTSDKATILLDQPLGLPSKTSSGPMKVVHARLEGNVEIRDDKGTRGKPGDDLVINLNYAEYDEQKLVIESESDLVVRDRDMRETGTGVHIDLRPKDTHAPAGQSAGFDGAKTIIIKKNNHIVVKDAGESGVLPGSAKAEQKTGSRTPLDIRCAGELRIDLPERPVWVKVGPPAPPAPTFAEFDRDVQVLRGKAGEAPDKLICDHLKLTLLPKEGPAKASKPEDDEDLGDEDGQSSESEGPLNDLTIRRAVADGHAVWLVSMAQESQAQCVQLIYDKLLPREPDKIYLRADTGKKLYFQKIDRVEEGPDQGKVHSVTVVRSADATIFDDGKSGGASTIVARGPGILEMHPALDKPAERTATWENELDIQTLKGPAGDKRVHKKITLIGRPKLVDPAQASLDARKEIAIWLDSTEQQKDKSKVKAKGNDKDKVATTTAGQSLNNGAYEIRQLEAWDDVHLMTKSQKLTARERLVAQFKAAPAAAPAAGAPANPAPPPHEEAQAEKEEESKSSEPFSKADADRVFAWILQRPGQGASAVKKSAAGQSTSESEVQEVHLRGGVVFHQDPKVGKEAGTDASGEAMYLQNLGNSRWKILLADHDKDATPKANEKARPKLPAMASTEGHQITGPFISLDQALDESRVIGPGTLTLMTERGLLTDKGVKNGPQKDRKRVALKPPEDAQAEKKRLPLTITWTKEMRFYGRKKDAQGKVRAIAEFVSVEEDAEGRVIPSVGNEIVLAVMEDARIGCRMMRVHMDRPISFTRVEQPPKMAEDVPVEPEPAPEITLIECFNDVTVVSRKVDPEFKVLVQQQRIEAKDLLTYDKPTGDFHISGPGTVYLFNREGEGGGDGGGMPRAGARPAARAPIRPAANPSRPALRNGQQANRGNAPIAKGKDQKKINPALVPLKLTQVKFSEQMKGRFGMGTDEENTEPRWAEFFGNIESLHGPVPDVKTALGVSPDLNFRLNADKLRSDDSFMTAQMMRVISEPPPTGSPEDTPAGNFLYAWKNVNVRFDTASIEADRATYDSTKDLYYAYGDDDRKIFLSQQNGPGQPNSQSSGSAVRYNHRTGEAQIDNPLALQLVDKTGSRPRPPAKPKPAPPKKFRKLNPPSRNSVERKGMQGGK